MFQYNLVIPAGSAVRFACGFLVASEANNVSARGGRVVHGAFIPLQNLCAGPPREALLSRCFLVTSLHQQRSDPLSEGQRKLCSFGGRREPPAEVRRLSGPRMFGNLREGRGGGVVPH